MARKIRMQDFAHLTRVPEKSRRPIVSKAWQQSLQEYPVQGDYYKQVREGMVRVHKRGESIDKLADIINKVHHDKQPHVARVVKAYIQWCEGHVLEFFPARKGYWQAHGVDVRVNPELGLVIDGVPHLIKVNFTKSPVPVAEAKIMAHLMHRALAPQVPENCVMAVLDLATDTLYGSTKPSPELDAVLDEHAAEVWELWEQAEASQPV
ncbi:MAG: hypothetical protein JXA57_19105 [Armatimonadetes bacterium]|nr:hypothetical protein [Armatimonadota bacterium]